MGTAKTSLDLLLCEDDAASDGLAELLEEHNRERQKIQNSVFEQAAAMVEDDPSFREQKVLVVHGDNWHRGVLGIAASKLTDRYARPSVVISFSDGLGTGSARSIEGFHLNEAFAACASALESFGGHSRAAGLKVRRDKVSDLRALINVFAGKNLAADMLPVIDVDAQLPLAQVSMELLGQLAALEPYGEANPAPFFATRHLRLKTSVQVMGKETVKFWVTDGRVACQAVGFGMAKVCSDLKIGQPVDIVYNLAVDDWNKVAQPQLTLKDIRPGKSGQKQ
jgi:single-stranded-DNA-specific exonuclease